MTPSQKIPIFIKCKKLYTKRLKKRDQIPETAKSDQRASLQRRCTRRSVVGTLHATSCSESCRRQRATSPFPKSRKTLHLTPYNSMGNNPVSMVDPDGDEIFTIVGALLAPVTGGASLAIGIAADLGGIGNVAYNYSKGNIDSWGAGLKAYGIGAAAGGGAVALTPIAVGATGLTLTGGFVAGAVYGGVGAGIGETIRNTGNSAVFNDVTWGEFGRNVGLGIVGGVLTGGTYQGLKDAYGFDPFRLKFKFQKTGKIFWNGKPIAPGRSVFSISNIPKGDEWGPMTWQNGDNYLKSFSSDYAMNATGKNSVDNYRIWDKSAKEAFESFTNAPYQVDKTYI